MNDAVLLRDIQVAGLDEMRLDPSTNKFKSLLFALIVCKIVLFLNNYPLLGKL